MYLSVSTRQFRGIYLFKIRVDIIYYTFNCKSLGARIFDNRLFVFFEIICSYDWMCEFMYVWEILAGDGKIFESFEGEYVKIFLMVLGRLTCRFSGKRKNLLPE